MYKLIDPLDVIANSKEYIVDPLPTNIRWITEQPTK